METILTFDRISNDPVTRANTTYPYIFWDNAFSIEEIDQIVEYCDGFDLERGGTFGSGDKETEIREDIRKSSILFHSVNMDNAWIFNRLNTLIMEVNASWYNFDLNGYTCFQYTTYNGNENEYYDWHMDMCLGENKVDNGQTRKLSMSLLLNDDYEGGDFCIKEGNDGYPVETKKGRAIFFPSFVLHRVAPVTKGIRKSLVIWVTGPKFI